MNAGTSAGPLHFALPPNGQFLLTIDPALRDLVEAWLPTTADLVPIGSNAIAHIRVNDMGFIPNTGTNRSQPAGDPALTFGPIFARFSETPGEERLVRLDGDQPGILNANIDLQRAHADCLVESSDARAEAYLRDALTVCTALLLGSQGHALIHSAAVCAAGGVWLVTGDARSGKSSCVIALVKAGHDWLSDDQVVLSAGSDGHAPVVHGWPRSVHLDTGWGKQRPSGERTRVDPATIGPGQLIERGAIAGVLVPEIRPSSDSRLEPLSRSEVLETLIRQSPWLMADPVAAPGILRLLETIASRPAFRLVLGAGSFGNGRLISSLLRDAAPGE